MTRIEMVSPWGRKSTVTCVKVDKSIGHLIYDSSAVDLRRVQMLRAAVFISTATLTLPVSVSATGSFKLGPVPFFHCHCFEADVPQMICWCLSKQS